MREALNCVVLVVRLVLYLSTQTLYKVMAIGSGAEQAQRSERVRTYFGTTVASVVIVIALTLLQSAPGTEAVATFPAWVVFSLSTSPA